MHISLDSALGRQRRLNSVGESVLQIAPNAAAAYSLRSLTGGDPKVVRVRRDTDGGAGDNDEQDFTASGISSGALVAFVGSGNDGFVETWYDQSGNSKDAVQATAANQPQIVSAGALVVDSAGLPEIDFDGSNDCLTASSYSRSGEDLPLTMISVFDQDVAGIDYVVSLNQTNNNAFDRILLRTDSFDYGRRATDNSFKAGSGSDPDVDTKYLFTAINSGTTSSGFVDGSSIFSGVDTNVATQALNQIDIGANNGDSVSGQNPFDGKIQEIIIYETDQSDNRLALEANIMTNYGIS